LTRTLIVDWLGRGGIAQCSNAIAAATGLAESDGVIVTVEGRELHGAHVVGIDGSGNRPLRHRALARAAASVIRERRPGVVVVQNYVIPPLERPVFAAAGEVGARLVVVVHDHRLHSGLAGTSLGLDRNLRMADVVVTHSHYVADRLPAAAPSEVVVLPHPVPPEFRHPDPATSVLSDGGSDLLALHFGVLKRSYKGTGVVEQLARRGVDGWWFAAVGVSAPTGVPGLESVPRFVTAAELAATVASSDAVLLPYTHATQSGAVSLSQARGTVPIANAVGGIPEQIEDGRTGLLIERDAGIDAWLGALERLVDPDERHRIGAAAAERAESAQQEFERGIRSLVR
jgi:glycosyltransferase involved in cell wall biosynthesis